MGTEDTVKVKAKEEDIQRVLILGGEAAGFWGNALHFLRYSCWLILYASVF